MDNNAAPVMPMNHQDCQKYLANISRISAPGVAQLPSLLEAMTRKPYWPAGTKL